MKTTSFLAHLSRKACHRSIIQFSIAWLAWAYPAILMTAAPVYFPDRQYHSAFGRDGKLKNEKLPSCVEHDPRGFDLLFVEFDERGDFWDRDQLANGSRAIKNQALNGKQILLI